MYVVRTTTIEHERIPEEGDRFWFHGGVNGYPMESLLGKKVEATDWHGEGFILFGGHDSIHRNTPLEPEDLEWDEEKNMWWGGYLS